LGRVGQEEEKKQTFDGTVGNNNGRCSVRDGIKVTFRDHLIECAFL
jgi:hypothetical protein